MSDFMKAVSKELINGSENLSTTENGALGYKSSGKALVDLNFKVSSLRNKTDKKIIEEFEKAFFENKELALKWLFYTRDIRGGLGERKIFRVITKWLADNYPDTIKNILYLIPEYGRWDDLIDVLTSTSNKEIFDIASNIIRNQLKNDIVDMSKDKSISLLAKWMPSVNASSSDTIKKAKKMLKILGLTEREYRKTLSKLRKYIDVVEVKMSSNKWYKINYEAVPSKANLIYKNAFIKHDEDRRLDYLDNLVCGKAKINSTTLYPHDIVSKYTFDNYHCRTKKFDVTLEELWKALPDKTIENTLVVADGSGSMYTAISGNTTAEDVCCALAIYFSEHSKGGFNNKFITFGNKPRLVDISNAESLKEKIDITLSNTDCSNTNIARTFKLILDTALSNHMTQEEMPKNVLIISDMEFDVGCNYNTTLFNEISQEFIEHGYKLPRLVFWNVNSRTGTIPVKENELGVALVSGFSTNIVDMVMSSELDPYKCLLKVLLSKRYELIKLETQSK